MWRERVPGVLLALLLLLPEASEPQRAQSQAPSPCASEREQRMFDLGVRKGGSLARQLMATLPPCDERTRDDVLSLQYEVLEVLLKLDPPAAPTQAARCHAVGTVAGLLSGLCGLHRECPHECHTSGAHAGRHAGAIYCELAAVATSISHEALLERLP